MAYNFGRLMHQDDHALLQACIDGNQIAWNELVERYGRLVYSIPYRHGLAPEDAEEVFQNVFTIVFRQLEHLRNHDAFAGWLVTITRREVFLVSRKSHHQSELDDNIEDHQPPPVELVQRWERLHFIHEALKRLESPCRELLTILFLEEPAPSYEEIAKRLKMPVGSIGPNRGRCLRKLEIILSDMKVDLSR